MELNASTSPLDASLSQWTGWITLTIIALAATVPIVQRLRTSKRAPPRSRVTSTHVAIGLGAAAFASFHTLTVLPSLGSPAAVGGGMAALAPAFLGLFVLVAHVGIGLRLRDPGLKDRPRQRRTHVTTAVLIAIFVSLHVVVLLRAA